MHACMRARTHVFALQVDPREQTKMSPENVFANCPFQARQYVGETTRRCMPHGIHQAINIVSACMHCHVK